MVVTIRQQRNKDDDDKVEKKTGESTFNPYKEAKKTGKSVLVTAEERKRELLKLREAAKRKAQKG